MSTRSFLLFSSVLISGLAACTQPEAQIDGSVAGIQFNDTEHVFFGGEYLVVGASDIECMDLAFIEEVYDISEPPTDGSVQLLQLAWIAGDMTTGSVPVGISASVEATVLQVTDGTFEVNTRAEAGTVNVESFDDAWALGSFDGLTFEDGSLSGSFTAEYCRNLDG